MFVDIYDTDQKYDLIVADPPCKNGMEQGDGDSRRLYHPFRSRVSALYV